jgi:hypothetical protein
VMLVTLRRLDEPLREWSSFVFGGLKV